MIDRYDKYYDFSGSFVMGCIFILIGVVILIGMEKLYEDIIFALVIIFLIISLFNLFKYISNYKNADNSFVKYKLLPVLEKIMKWIS